jgi:mannose-6-phosphate isomerase-like protein (cupin superfamily)
MKDTEQLPAVACLKGPPDYHAPDGSEIRLLSTMLGGGTCHCTLPVGRTSLAVAHRHVEDIWYVLSGEGEVWRKSPYAEVTAPIRSGCSLNVPPRTSFQRGRRLEPAESAVATRCRVVLPLP